MRFSRLLSILALFAVLFAPAGMLGSHAAMAMPQQASAGHHSEQQQHDQRGQDQAMIDCAIACTALPSNEPVVAEEELIRAAAPQSLPSLVLHGTKPEAATPPPRFS